MDQDSAFMSSLMPYLLANFNIKIRTVAPHSHQLLQAEHGIKSLSTILTKHLTNLGQMWPKYLPLPTSTYNTFNNPNLQNYSPYELIFGRKLRPLLNLDSNPDIKVSGMLCKAVWDWFYIFISLGVTALNIYLFLFCTKPAQFLLIFRFTVLCLLRQYYVYYMLSIIITDPVFLLFIYLFTLQLHSNLELQVSTYLCLV